MRTLTAEYEIEIDENANASICDCCGKESCNGHGFIYKNGDAYAIYVVAWSAQHAQSVVTLALAIGEWGDGATSADRTCFGLNVYRRGDQLLFSVIGPERSPLSYPELMGPMLPRGNALEHPLLREAFTITERIMDCHPAVREYLSVT